MNLKIKIGMAALALTAVSSVRADEEEWTPEQGSYGWTPIAFGLATPVQLPWGYNKWDVFGLDLNILFAEAPYMYGVQIAAGGNLVEKETRGLAVGGFFNWARGDVRAVRASVGLNYAAGTVYGVDIGAIGYHRVMRGLDVELACCVQDSITGVNVSLLGSYSREESYGCTIGALNISRGTAYGMQLGLYNQCEELHGCQLALVNYARECPWGFQIGLVNVILDNKLKVLPIVNGFF